jgi:hypothetical protein
LTAIDNIANRKLIRWLVPDPKCGQIKGLLATTYELDPDFLETDFLPSVLGLTSRTAWTTRIAMEKRLSEMETRAVILTEARRYRGRPRSLQLEIVPAVSPRGSSLHAKVTVIVFERAVRLLVGSANLTERGYRKNRESAAVFTATKNDPAHAEIVLSAISSAESALSRWLTPDATKVLRSARDILRPWTKQNSDASVSFVWSDIQHQLWQTFLANWTGADRMLGPLVCCRLFRWNAATLRISSEGLIPIRMLPLNPIEILPPAPMLRTTCSCPPEGAETGPTGSQGRTERGAASVKLVFVWRAGGALANGCTRLEL